MKDELMYGQGVMPDTAYRDMVFAKKMFHQEKGKQYLHLVVSEDRFLRNPLLSRDIGKEIAGFFDDYQVLVATHTDTDNLHAHLIINTVNMATGKKLNLHRKDFWALREYANKVFDRYNLPGIGAEQVYDTLVNTDIEWEDDLEEFDDLIHSQLADYENELGCSRAIYFDDPDMERADVLSSLDRAERRLREVRMHWTE